MATILVVDDELMIRDMLKQFLTGQGYHVPTAHNGDAALALVEEEQPQMIILDLYMPGMNGGYCPPRTECYAVSRQHHHADCQ